MEIPMNQERVPIFGESRETVPGESPFGHGYRPEDQSTAVDSTENPRCLHVSVEFASQLQQIGR